MRDRHLKIEFLFIPGCESSGPALRLLRQVLAKEHCEAPVTVRIIQDEQSAVRRRFHGSPTILIDGVDIEGPSVDHDGSRLRCRTYLPYAGRPGVPPADLIRTALHIHPAKRRPQTSALQPSARLPCPGLVCKAH